MRLLLLVILLFTFLRIHAQIDTTINRDSRSEKIEKARKLLLDAVVEMNKAATSELTKYLHGQEDEDYTALSRWSGGFSIIGLPIIGMFFAASVGIHYIQSVPLLFKIFNVSSPVSLIDNSVSDEFSCTILR